MGCRDPSNEFKKHESETNKDNDCPPVDTSEQDPHLGTN